MTAGRGIAHSERFDDPAALAADGFEMIQSWVALPEADEESTPSFENYRADQLPVATGDGVWMRLIAGSAFGLANPVQTHSPLFYLHVVLQPGATVALPDGHAERAAYVAKGSVAVDGHVCPADRMLVFGRQEAPAIVAQEATTMMLLGGEPLGERFIWWTFVTSRKERIEQAKADWEAGHIGRR